MVYMADIATTYGASGRRSSRHINRKPASNLHHAVRLADVIRLPLTHLVTLDFSGMPDGVEWATARFQRLVSGSFTPWLTRPGTRRGVAPCKPTYIWVAEGKAGTVHVHWLVHIPPARLLEFEACIRAWMEKAVGQPVADDAVHILRADTPKALSKYLLKGIDPLYAAFYGVRHEPQGLVCGKRSGFSRNLGPSVKRRLRGEGQYRHARRMSPAGMR